MAIRAVGLLSPGEMGSAVARVLIAGGLPVLSCLEGRSERTWERARAAGIREVPTCADLVTACDLVLSILAPAQAVAAARRVGEALRRTGASLLYVDCNAVAPATAREVAEIVATGGGTCVDAGIIGPPPTRPGVTRFYASGQRAADFAALGAYGLDVRVLGSEIGQASGFKMCYAALTKGITALAIAQLVAAARLGLLDSLVAELRQSQPDRYADMTRSLPACPARAGRWIGEMEEIARTFAAAGVPPGYHVGAAEVYRLVHEVLPGGLDAGGDADAALAEFVRRLARALD
ncbi:MAG: DUF1932 domain-containing protein [Gemmatimonadota bacterium]